MKDLPYCKFYTGEYLAGDITVCDMKTQGVFINICCYYWNRQGQYTIESAKMRFKEYETEIDKLVELNILKVDNGNFIIEFLDEQLEEREKLHDMRSVAGSKGGKSYSNSDWTDLDRKNGSQLYILIMYDDSEIFVKVGITDKSISRRYSKKIDYTIKTIYQYFGDDTLQKEIELERILQEYKYVPKSNFDGYTEVFSIDSLNKIDAYFDKLDVLPQANHKQIISIAKPIRREENRKEKDIYIKKHIEIKEKKEIEKEKEINKEKEKKNIYVRVKKFKENVSDYIKGNPKYLSVKDVFIEYWTEPNKKKTRLRYEDEKFFDMGKRLGTFLKNSNRKYGKTEEIEEF